MSDTGGQPGAAVAVFALAVGQTLAWAGLFYVFPVLLLPWEDSFGWPRPNLTAAISLALLASAAGARVAGRLIDKGLGAPMMAGAAALGGLGMIALGSVQTLCQFYAGWIWIGLMMAGCLYEPCFAILTRARGMAARRPIVVITLVAGFASTVSFPVTHLLTQAVGWEQALRLIGAGVIVLAAPLLWFGVRGIEAGGIEAPGQAAPSRPELSGGAARRRVFWLIALCFACVAILHGAVLQHLLPYLAEQDHAEGFGIFVASLIGPMQVAGRLVLTVTARRISLHAMTMLVFVLMIGSALTLLVFGWAEAGALVFVLAFGSAYGIVSILRPLVARAMLGGVNFGATSGALSAVYLVGAAAAPWLGALVWAVAGYGVMLAGCAALALAGALFYVMATRRAGKPGAATG
nr:MFS transporter [Alexandriicola marinus]